MYRQTVMFQGFDSHGQKDFWLTNGTGFGTYELVPDVAPGDFTVFNGKVFFNASPAGSFIGFWVTDGTAAGTHELNGISGASSGLAPAEMTVFRDIFSSRNEVMFRGFDASSHAGLWVSDGTAAGTQELTGISGAGSNFSPADLTVFHPRLFLTDVLFRAFDASGLESLWASQGTAASTHELTGISGASSSGLFPSNLTVFNGKVLFSGRNASNLTGLWVTDLSASGTHELTGISGAFAPAGLTPSELTVFDGEVLFSGCNANNQTGLWVTDGTATGTHEITGISGASSAGITPFDLTLFNGAVLFAGLDASGGYGLWVTDGTATGTHELTGIQRRV